MPVPSFQEMMLPFLQAMSDGQEHSGREVTQTIIKAFNLSDEDVNDLVPSGGQTRLNNRVGWCRTHLKNAGLITYVRQGVFRITERGQQVLASNPESIDLKFLDQFEEHRQWFHRKPATATAAGAAATKLEESEASAATPDEIIGNAKKDLDDSLRADLLDQLHQVDPFRFEQIVLDLLFAMGYGGSREEAAKVTKKSNDEGIDGVINEDRLGLDVIYVQAKRWQGVVGRKEIQSFVGALAGKQANKGVFITTSGFTSNATDFARHISQKVVLIDGPRLADLMIEHNIGVSTVRTIAIKRLDSDYFEES